MASTSKATATKTAATTPAKAVSPSPAAVPKVTVKAPAKPLAVTGKPAAPKKAKPVVKTVAKPKADKPAKPKKPKLVRDSFTIPKSEYLILDELKARANKLASPAKKSELLRAGIKALAAMPDAALLAALKAVPAIKTGRPAMS